MSRLAKKPITIPQKTDVSVANGVLTVKGPKGELSRPMHRLVAVESVPEGMQVSSHGNSLEGRALLGTYASHLKNMVAGVNNGFVKKLLVEGVGYRWEVAGSTLNLALGFSHPVKVQIPQGLEVKTERSTLTVSGIDKEAVGQFAANIRALKPPEPYKGKGIRYEGEVIRRKQGKKAA
ncbi:MAG: 50S ribosomal protein L6 [Minisyncoccia bacterium]